MSTIRPRTLSLGAGNFDARQRVYAARRAPLLTLALALTTAAGPKGRACAGQPHGGPSGDTRRSSGPISRAVVPTRDCMQRGRVGPGVKKQRLGSRALIIASSGALR